MGRLKGKEKKVPLSVTKEEAGSEEESVPLQRKRGRPRKVVKDEVVEEELKEAPSFTEKVQTAATEAGKKRKRQKKTGDGSDSGADKNAEVNRGGFDESTTPVTAKRQGNRRKGKPRRAAGAFIDGK